MTHKLKFWRFTHCRVGRQIGFEFGRSGRSGFYAKVSLWFATFGVETITPAQALSRPEDVYRIMRDVANDKLRELGIDE